MTGAGAVGVVVERLRARVMRLNSDTSLAVFFPHADEPCSVFRSQRDTEKNLKSRLIFSIGPIRFRVVLRGSKGAGSIGRPHSRQNMAFFS